MTQPVDPKSIAGKNVAPTRHVPVVVVGGGPTGVAAATAAARAGARVLLLDEHPLDPELMAMDVPLFFGQRMSPAVRDRGVMLERVVRANPALDEAIDAGVEVELGMSVWGAFRPGPVMRELGGACVGVADQTRSWLVGYDQLIVAAGARDLNLAFRGWEKAGTMGAAAALALLTRYQALAARRMVILGSGPLALAVATLARARGIEVPAIVEVSATLRGDAQARARLEQHGVRFYPGHVVAEALGSRDELEGVRLAAIDRDLRLIPGSAPEIACDTVCLAVGLIPQIELLQILGCRLAFHSERGGFVPEIDDDQRTSLGDVFAPGDVAGVDERHVLAPERGIAAGRRAGVAAAAALGTIAPAQAQALLRETPVPPLALAPRAHDYWRQWLQATLAASGWDILACQCEEVTRGELVGVQPPRYLGPRSAPMQARNLGTLKQDGPPNPDQVKRLTRAGMGPCQGRRCREQVALLLAEAGDVPVDTIALASYRPPVRPLPLSVLWPHDEPESMREHWVSWFGIPTQFAPHWAGDPDMTVSLDVPGGMPVE
jgi:NADPH-dependent 2,4-dienoyl-CoA reductase/sulfur reductase-like enzyme